MPLASDTSPLTLRDASPVLFAVSSWKVEIISFRYRSLMDDPAFPEFDSMVGIQPMFSLSRVPPT
jgi:hypothetical protein